MIRLRNKEIAKSKQIQRTKESKLFHSEIVLANASLATQELLQGYQAKQNHNQIKAAARSGCMKHGIITNWFWQNNARNKCYRNPMRVNGIRE